jgi:Ulp1 family protease
LKTQKPTIPDKLSAEESAIVRPTFWYLSFIHLSQVRQTLSNRAFKTTVVGNENIEPKNISRFQQGWLADDNITYYLALVAARNASSPSYPNIHCFNTFFYAKISTAGHSAVRRWTKKVCRDSIMGLMDSG